jgi:uncharacterized membrane protein YagU involved in acid resistance
MQEAMEISEIPRLLTASVTAGLLGAAGMTGTMTLIDRLGLANAKMEVAIGSLVTKSRERAVGVGLTMHFVAGVCFSIFYTALFVILGVRGIAFSTAVGTIAGFVHGFAMSFILIIAVAEHHPLPEFQEAGFSVAVAHVVGHVVYGALVGLVLGVAGSLR